MVESVKPSVSHSGLVPSAQSIDKDDPSPVEESIKLLFTGPGLSKSEPETAPSESEQVTYKIIFKNEIPLVKSSHNLIKESLDSNITGNTLQYIVKVRVNKVLTDHTVTIVKDKDFNLKFMSVTGSDGNYNSIKPSDIPNLNKKCNCKIQRKISKITVYHLLNIKFCATCRTFYKCQ